MKLMLALTLLLSFSAFSQDPVSYINSSDNKIYSLKTKGVKDFVVDIESTKLSKQIDEQKIFGKVNRVVFRTYWTQNPERIDVEVLGLPEGFKEAKEQLRVAAFGLVESLLPPSTVQKFGGFKISPTNNPKEFVAKDTTGLALVPSYQLKYDSQDRLSEIVGHKVVGTYVSKSTYGKDAFSDGKWVLQSNVTQNSENGQTVTIRKDLKYGDSEGMGVLTAVKVTTEQKINNSKDKPLTAEEVIEFKDYKINKGFAQKHFLSLQSER